MPEDQFTAETGPLVIIHNTVLFYRPGVRPWVGRKTLTPTPTHFLPKAAAATRPLLLQKKSRDTNLFKRYNPNA